ncbi:hypothetical protein EST38_g8570 [Candolleomyces aberdarensis]|uniref:Uncharacterized protein n=1 Tax=Candolleomyces aberdarensis TaxID=2316362 RepID=A0A4Q2DCB1_9AGAR|nr:hypothetical protein EST38_g8570 [Candolleomyces aberdarensis]
MVGRPSLLLTWLHMHLELELVNKYPRGLLSLYKVRALVEKITGVVAVEDDMCINSCHAFTGDWATLDKCTICDEPRYNPKALQSNKKIPQQQMCTIPLGPQIQAIRRSEPGSEALQYRSQKVEQILKNIQEDGNLTYDDIFCGNDFLELHQRRNITKDDVVIGFSIDGAQLYQDKKSDAWIAIWIIYDYDPTTRYKRKHILPALVIPGPNKPKNLDSFLFRSFYHLSALQREGLKAFDYCQQIIINTHLYFILATADAVGLVDVDGRVGHHGAQGCRVGCPMKGRHKPGSGHYYAAHLKPATATVVTCDHGDYDFNNIARPSPDQYRSDLEKVRLSQNQAVYEQNRLATGICKPSIISGLNPEMMLEPPKCFTVDLMHLFYNNVPVLFLALWRGNIRCEHTDTKDSWFWVSLTGKDWEQHGLDVANAGQYLPSLFHRVPRNPALKISSSYKCTEYNTYFYKLGRGLFRKYLPPTVWKHYCLLVHAVDILAQRSITPEQVADAHIHIVRFVMGFETLYYQRREDRIHFCRPALHTLLHTPSEVYRIGPGPYATQYTMENIIGDLGGEIRQHATPFANLKKIALRRCQINAIKVIYPEVDLDSTI